MKVLVPKCFVTNPSFRGKNAHKKYQKNLSFPKLFPIYFMFNFPYSSGEKKRKKLFPSIPYSPNLSFHPNIYFRLFIFSPSSSIHPTFPPRPSPRPMYVHCVSWMDISESKLVHKTPGQSVDERNATPDLDPWLDGWDPFPNNKNP